MTDSIDLPATPAPTDARRRWRLVLGSDAESACGGLPDATDAGMDRTLAALYGGLGIGGSEEGGPASKRKPRGGLQSSAPSVSRWLGDIRSYFPASVVHLLQQDALERLNLRALLLSPDVLETIQPDVRLVADLINLSGAIPEKDPRHRPFSGAQGHRRPRSPPGRAPGAGGDRRARPRQP